ncbi:MAG: hypothetical protein H7333_00395 [Bdellovibrionales bacterium]|nr:hypothetical protein [Oligoflexia bacterium]
MRLKIFGIPRLSLVFFALLPVFVWCAFHLTVAIYHEQAFAWVMGFALALALFFPYLFCRGIFRSRILVLLFLFVEIGFELLSGVMDKDFSRLSGALFAFGIGIWLTFWLEKRVHAADLNPKNHWFEGAPQTYPQIRAKIKTEEEWQEGSLRTIDERGFFVFLNSRPGFRPKQSVPFELQYRDLQVSGEARLVACFSGERFGFGLQFSPKDLYHFSQYTALVQRLKGEGL